MDNLTHSLFGLTVARTPLGRTGRGTTVALLLASNAPDIDIITAIGGTASYLQWHRGPTHGPIGVAGLSLLCALIAQALAKWRSKPTDDPVAPLSALWPIAILGVVCHVLMDLPTSYGTRPLSPFSWTWFAEDWMPIVDIYLWAILGGGLLLTRRAARITGTDLRVRNAMLALGLVAGVYGVRAASHRLALADAPRVFGAQLPPRCADATAEGRWIDRWPVARATTPRDASAGRCLIEIAAFPDFFSPFRWQLVAQLSNAYERRAIDLLAPEPRDRPGHQLTSIRYPNQWTPAVEHAARSRIGRIYLGFSRFPAARSSVDAGGIGMVRWSDMRFVAVSGGEERRSGLFAATIRVAPDGAILEERLGP